MVALDTDEDGELSPDEIKNAVTALKELDKNDDGKLSGDELRPQFGPPDGPGGGGHGEFRAPGAAGRGPGEFRRPEPGGPRGPGGPDAGGPRRGGPGGGNFADRIMRFDTNGDGKVGKDELPEPMQPMLERADSNNDDAIDRAEAEAMAERFRGGRAGPARGDRPDGGPGPPPRRPE
jgi:collagen type III alpha